MKKPENIAVIDLGTNTFHLLIGRAEPGGPVITYKTQEPVKLGEDLTLSNRIIPAAFQRGIQCLKKFRETIDSFGVLRVKATATSGVRSALNGADFVAQAKAEADIHIEVIDGDTEATYIYEGVKWSSAISETALIMDIGGGSTEFILCNPEKLLWKKSYDIGAARLMQRFFHSDPLSSNDAETLHEHLMQELPDLLAICALHQPQVLVGSAGAFETFYEMSRGIPTTRLQQGGASVPADENHSRNTSTHHAAARPLDYLRYRQLAEKLIAATHAERAAMKGLIPLRVDMIVMAAFLTNLILDRLSIRKITLSTYDLKMGVLKSL